MDVVRGERFPARRPPTHFAALNKRTPESTGTGNAPVVHAALLPTGASVRSNGRIDLDRRRRVIFPAGPVPGKKTNRNDAPRHFGHVCPPPAVSIIRTTINRFY